MENDQINANRLKIGWAIRNVRLNAGYSQEELADLLSVNKSTISKIEKGVWSLSLDYLYKICGVLDLELEINFKNKDKNLTIKQTIKMKNYPSPIKVEKTNYEVFEYSAGYFGISEIGKFGNNCIHGGDSANEDDYNKEYIEEVYSQWNGTLYHSDNYGYKISQ